MKCSNETFHPKEKNFRTAASPNTIFLKCLSRFGKFLRKISFSWKSLWKTFFLSRTFSLWSITLFLLNRLVTDFATVPLVKKSQKEIFAKKKSSGEGKVENLAVWSFPLCVWNYNWSLVSLADIFTQTFYIIFQPKIEFNSLKKVDI